MDNNEESKIVEELEPHLNNHFAGQGLLYFFKGCNIDFKTSPTGPNQSKLYRIASLQNIPENYFHISILGFNIGPEILLLLHNDIINTFIKQQKESFPYVSASNPLYGIKERDNRNIVFSKNIYLFTDILSIDENYIIQEFAKYGFQLIVSDNAYRQKLFDLKKPDLFICHDSRDKSIFVDELYKSLIRKPIKVWYDTYSLKVGDSLTEKIEEGTKNCRFGALVLSKNFLSNEQWTKFELQSLKVRQILENRNLILPIWLDIDKNDLLQFSPWLVDKKAALAKDGMEKVINEIFEVIK